MPRNSRWSISLSVLLLLGCSGRAALLQDGGAEADVEPVQDLGAYLAAEGLIYLAEVSDSSGAQQGAAFAFFAPPPLPFFAEQDELGAGCMLYPSDEVGEVQYSAGMVVVESQNYRLELKAEQQDKPGDWLYPAMLYPDLFAEGSEVHVQASGQQVEPFSGVARGVGELVVTEVPEVIRRSEGLTLRYLSQPGTAWITLVGLQGGQQVGGTIRCTHETSGGEIALPAEALGHLSQHATGVNLMVGLVHEVLVSLVAGGKIHLVTHNARQFTRQLEP